MSNTERNNGNSSSHSKKNTITIHKVFTVPIQRHRTPDEINGYFERFGAIESIEVYTKNNHQFASIEFKSADAAKMVLSHSIHHISKCAFTVSSAIEQDSALLNTLNDDCFRKIFQYLNVMALSNAADVCIRFNQLATKAFIANYRQNLVEIDLKNDWSNSKYFRKLDEIEAIFRNFGALIRFLQIKNKCWNNGSRKMFGTILMNVASQHITSSSLKELNLIGVKFNEQMTNFRPMFRNLEILSLTECNIKNNADNFLAACRKLKVLRINRCKLNKWYLDHKFPKLQELHFIACDKLEHFHLNKLIRSNHTLKKLKLEFDEVYSVDFFNLLYRNLPNLIELDIERRHYYGYDSRNNQQIMAQSLGRLTSLKVLKLNYKTMASLMIASLMNELVKNHVPIEHLELFEVCINNDAINGISQLKHLKFVKLVNIYDLVDDDIIALAKELPQLKELYLDCFYITFNGIENVVAHANKLTWLVFYPGSGSQMTKKGYQKMLQSVQNRPEKLKLTIKTKSRAVNVPDDVLLANQDWLRIPIERRFKKLDLLMQLRNLKLKF